MQIVWDQPDYEDHQPIKVADDALILKMVNIVQGMKISDFAKKYKRQDGREASRMAEATMVAHIAAHLKEFIPADKERAIVDAWLLDTPVHAKVVDLDNSCNFGFSAIAVHDFSDYPLRHYQEMSQITPDKAAYIIKAHPCLTGRKSIFVIGAKYNPELSFAQFCIDADISINTAQERNKGLQASFAKGYRIGGHNPFGVVPRTIEEGFKLWRDTVSSLFRRRISRDQECLDQWNSL